MTRRLRSTTASPDWEKYDRLLEEAASAFGRDVMYAVIIAESARTITDKKMAPAKTVRQPKT